MKTIVLILVFNLLLTLTSSYAQHTFSNYSINEGLSQSVVNCIYQDSKGFIWIGTQNGLNRFDGESFKIYSFNPDNPNSISNNWIYAIAEDTEGNLWIGTKGGLNKYITDQNKFLPIPYQANFMYDVTGYTYDIACLENGKILINTPPVISIFDPQTEIFTHYRNDLEYDEAVKDVKIPVLEDKDGNIWIGSSKGLSSFSLEIKQFTYYSFLNKNGETNTNSNITALFQDKKGILWAGTTDGLFNLNLKSGLFEESTFLTDSPDKFPFKNKCIRNINEDKKGNLIIGTEGHGLFVISTYSKKPVSIQNYTSENSTIGHNIVQSILIDKSENLWIGTLQGISKTDLKQKKFNLFRKSNSPNSIDLLGNVIGAIYKNDDGILWVGNWGQGLNLINRENRQVEHFSSQLSGNHYITNDFIHVIFKDSDKNIWLGTRDGIFVHNKTSNKFEAWHLYFDNPDLQIFDNVRIYMIIQDKASNYWIATQNGVYRISSDKSEIETFRRDLDTNHQLPANLAYTILEDSDGLIWIATINGLSVYNPTNQSIYHYNKEEKGLSSDFIISLCEDRHGNIWIGTNAFVNVYNKKDSTFTYFTEKHDLPSNYIYEILKDNNQNLWLATGRGLCRFMEEKHQFHTFTLEDGLQSPEFNLRAACNCPDGELFFGGMNGFNSFYPDSIAENPYKPNIVFTSFYKTKGADKEYINLPEKKELILNYNENSFTIEFAALEYTNPQKNNYAYKMEGISDQWVNTGNRKFAPFFGLPPGEYTFSVKGSNNDGLWNNEGDSIQIKILPPWWKSIYAYITYVTLILLSVIIFIKLRERRLKHDKKILEQKVFERTIQIKEQNQVISSKNEELRMLNKTKDKLFSIIGHDLGNQFNIILGFLEVLVSDIKNLDKDKIEYHLNNIFNTSGQAHELLENLLTWSKMQTNAIQFNPNNFNALKEINKSIDLLKAASNKKNISIEIKGNKEIEIYADKNMFSTISRNLVANAIKFTPHNGQISVFVHAKEKFCEIIIKDNGVGIQKERLGKLFNLDSNQSTKGTNGEKGSGLGLILCKEFIEKHKGTIQVKSESEKGSEFSFTIPLKK